jgi:hypothetical protein
VKLSFYTPIAYDYKYAFAAVKSYYNIADEIILAIDKDRISWSGIKYDFDDILFNTTIKEIDTNNKIKIIEESFHKTGSPITNDTNKRNEITKQCSGEIIIGIDSDEILINANEFAEWLKSYTSKDDISCHLMTVYKSFENKLLIAMPLETTVIGTKLRNSYKQARNTSNRTMLSPLKLLHYSWGRTEQELKQKLYNFGHSNQFNIPKYFGMWKNTTLDNYASKRFFHPLGPRQSNWRYLQLFDLKDVK